MTLIRIKNKIPWIADWLKSKEMLVEITGTAPIFDSFSIMIYLVAYKLALDVMTESLVTSRFDAHFHNRTVIEVSIVMESNSLLL